MTMAASCILTNLQSYKYPPGSLGPGASFVDVQEQSLDYLPYFRYNEHRI